MFNVCLKQYILASKLHLSILLDTLTKTVEPISIKMKFNNHIVHLALAVLIGFAVSTCSNTSMSNNSPNFEVTYSYSFPSDTLYQNTAQLRTVRVDNVSKWKVVYSQGARSVYLFDSIGEFQKVVGNNGMGPGEYLNILGLSFRDELIILNDQSSSKFIVYNYTGDFLFEHPYNSIGVNISFNNPELYLQNIVTSTGGTSRVPLVYAYDYRNGTLTKTFYASKSTGEQPNSINDRILIDSANESLFIVSQTSNYIDEFDRGGGTSVNRRSFSGLNFDEIKTELTVHYQVPTPNVFLDFRIYKDYLFLALNGPYRQILVFDDTLELAGTIDLNQVIQFEDAEYILSFDITNENIYVLTGMGPDKVHVLKHQIR